MSNDKIIRVSIERGGYVVELGRIDIEEIWVYPDGTADYSVRFGSDNKQAVVLRQRAMLSFPRNEYNVFALVLQALKTLEEEELKGDIGAETTVSQDLERGIGGAVPEDPRREG